MFTEDIISLVSVTISVEVRRHTSMATPERQTKRHRVLGRVSPVNPDVSAANARLVSAGATERR